MIKRFSKAIAALAVAALLVAEMSPLATTVYAAEEDTDSEDTVVAEEVVEDADDGAEEFVDSAEMFSSMAELEAATVSYKTLGAVSGVKYDSSTGYLTWNKVSGAGGYKVACTSSSGSEYTSYTTAGGLYMDVDAAFDLDDGSTYTFTVTAYYTDKIYILERGIDYSTYNSTYTKRNWYSTTYTGTKTVCNGYAYVSDGTSKLYTAYIYPSSSSASVSITYSDTSKSTSTTAKSAAPKITLKETYLNTTYSSISQSTTYYFSTVTSPVNLTYYGEYIVWEVSNNSKFEEDSEKGYWYDDSYAKSYDEGTGQISVSATKFKPGETIYVRCRVYNPYYVTTSDSDDKYSAYSNVVSVTTSGNISISSATTYTGATYVTLSVTNTSGSVTGYQFQKKVGKKWVTMSKQTSESYKYTKLTKNKKYSLRVRAYYYNENTKKTTYSSWYTTEAITWNAKLNFYASPASSKSIKLTWNKVSGATGYEIYRKISTSSADTYKNGMSTSNYTGYELVKVLGSSKKSYTDKKLTAGAVYYYTIRAYKEVNGTKIYISDSSYAQLAATQLHVKASYYNSKGQYVYKWTKLTGISGYIIEKYNTSTGTWSTYKKLAKNKTSYTFPKVNVGSDAAYYRIKPYKTTKTGTIYYDYETVTVYPQLTVVKNVKATATSTGIKITWSAVSGADYYRVYRTTDSHLTYNKTTKAYSLPSNYETVYNTYVDKTGYTAAGSAAYYDESSYSVYTIKSTSCIDTKGEYTYYYEDENGNVVSTTEEYNSYGAEEGVKYYYYVIACAYPTNGTVSYSSTAEYSSSSISSVGYSKPASACYTSVKKASAVKTSKLSVKSKKKGQVTVKVTSKKASGVKGYAIYRATKKKGSYVLVGITTSSSFTDTSATSGKTYYYKVAAIKESEAGEYIYGTKSAAKSVKVK